MNTRNSLAGVTGVDEAAVQRAAQVRSVYVYEAPVRLWHWVTVLAFVVLSVTGYFIGQPLPSVPGEASDWYLMGYIRFVHFAAGYVLAVAMIGRTYWAIVGNHHAREIYYLPVLRAEYWRELFAMAGWYLFLRPRPNQYIGHNPIARFAMVTMFMVGTIFMIVTGFALYGEGAQAGHWSHTAFTSWVLPLFGGNSQDVHTWHHLGMWYLACFVIVHVYAAVREDIMGRQSIVSTMISGHRTFKN